MQRPLAERGPSAARSLTNIKKHHEDFLRSGATRAQAKDVSFSVVNEPLVPIDIDHVSQI